MKRKIIYVMLIFAVISLTVISVTVYKNYDWFYTRFYTGNRVEGVYSITVEGKELKIQQFNYMLNDCDIEYKFDEEGFSTKIGEYGVHKIRFIIDNDQLYEITGDEAFHDGGFTEVGIDYFNTNNWHIFKLDINLNITKTADGWVVETNVKDNLYPFDDEWSDGDYKTVLLGEYLRLGP